MEFRPADVVGTVPDHGAVHVAARVAGHVAAGVRDLDIRTSVEPYCNNEVNDYCCTPVSLVIVKNK